MLRTARPDVAKREYVICTPIAPLKDRPGWCAGQDTELLFGSKFKVTALKDGWAEGQEISPIKDSKFPGYKGYVPADCLALSEANPTHRVSSLKAPIFTKPDIKSPIRFILPINALISGEISDGFLKSAVGFVHERHVDALATGAAGADFVSIAEMHLGLPYIWGGNSADGLDCSGLVQSSLRAIGRDFPRDSGDQCKVGRDIKSIKTLRRGDLVFWKGHVGIMTDARLLLHANAFHMCVFQEPLSEAVTRIGEPTGFKRLSA